MALVVLRKIEITTHNPACLFCLLNGTVHRKTEHGWMAGSKIGLHLFKNFFCLRAWWIMPEVFNGLVVLSKRIEERNENMNWILSH